LRDKITSPLIRLLGWPLPLFHSETAVLDRWLWIRAHLPRRDDSPYLVDIGCGSGAFSIGSALRGYRALGLSWDTRNRNVASHRATLAGANTARFELQDLRALDARPDLRGKFDVALMCEVIEHIIDDMKLVRDVAATLKPNGTLLLTTPNAFAPALDPSHDGPFPKVEDGGHVRKGYTPERLIELCRSADLEPQEISYCTGFISQMLFILYFRLSRINRTIAWLAVHPFRLFPPLLDARLSRFAPRPPYSICLVARKLP